MAKLEILHHRPKEGADKPPLLFVHGMWHGAWCWEPNFLPYFAQNGYHAYALSLRNHAESGQQKPIWRVRLSDYVDDVRRVVEEIKGDPILIGHSMGGMIVQKYVEKYAAPRAILLASVPPYGITGATLKVVKKFPFAFLKANLTLNLHKVIDNKKKALQLLFSDDLPQKQADDYFSRLQNEAYLAYLDMMIFNLPKSSKMSIPKMLVLGGKDDKVVSVKDISNTAKKYSADMVIIDRLAHDVMLDTRWKQAAESILEWIQAED